MKLAIETMVRSLDKGNLAQEQLNCIYVIVLSSDKAHVSSHQLEGSLQPLMLNGLTNGLKRR